MFYHLNPCQHKTLTLIKCFEFKPETKFSCLFFPPLFLFVLKPDESAVLEWCSDMLSAAKAQGSTTATRVACLLEELKNLRAGGEGGGKGEDAHKCLRHKLWQPQGCDDFCVQFPSRFL